MRAYSSSEVQSLTGVNRNQLTHWTDAGLVQAEIVEAGGRGKHRRFSFMNLVQVAVANELAAGYGVPRARLQAWLPCVSLGVLAGRSHLFFFSDGRSFAGGLDTPWLNVTGRKDAPPDRSALVVELKVIVDELSQKTGEAPPRPKKLNTVAGMVELSKSWSDHQRPQRRQR